MDARNDAALAADEDFFSTLEVEAHFYIVRHGQSVGNARGIAQGRMDLPLDELGRAQAAKAGAYLAAEGADLVLSSPLVLASETASIIASAASLAAPTLRHEFIEIDTGLFSGLSSAQFELLHPEAYERFRRASWDGVPGAEGAAVLYERAMSAWTVLLDAASEGMANGKARRVVCVTHGGFIQWLVRASFGSSAWFPLVPVSNCGITELYVEPDRPGRYRPFVQWKRFDFVAPEAR